MEVSCEFLDAHTTDTTDQIAGRSINAAGTGNFFGKVNKHVDATGTILLDDGMEMLVVGGRHSICQAFATNPVAQYVFTAPPGKVIFASRAASSRKGWAFRAGAMRATQVLTGPAFGLIPATVTGVRTGNPLFAGSAYLTSLTNTYSPKMNKAVAGVLNQASKTRTVLHLFAESANFGGHALGRRLNGAQLSLELSQFFV